jgi:hypothetical protein
MSAKAHLTLVPSLVPSGSTRELQRSGRALTFTLSPSDNSLAAFVTNAVRTSSVYSLLEIEYRLTGSELDQASCHNEAANLFCRHGHPAEGRKANGI